MLRRSGVNPGQGESEMVKIDPLMNGSILYLFWPLTIISSFVILIFIPMELMKNIYLHTDLK